MASTDEVFFSVLASSLMAFSLFSFEGVGGETVTRALDDIAGSARAWPAALEALIALFCCGCGRDSSSCSCSLAGRKLPLVLTLKIICSARRGFRYYAGVMTRQMSNQRSYGSCC